MQLPHPKSLEAEGYQKLPFCYPSLKVYFKRMFSLTLSVSSVVDYNGSG